MSASREKKSRQDTGTGYTDPKTAREAAARSKQKRADWMYAGIGIVFLAVAIFVVVYNSGILQKGPAATVNGETYSSTEVNFYFKNAYNSYANSQYASYFGLSATTDLKNTDCPLAEEGTTWYDFLLGEATKTMGDLAQLNAAAKADGFTVEDLDAKVQEQMDAMAQHLKVQSTTVKEYLKRVYGKNMTESLYRELLGEQIVAQEYQASYTDSLTYTDSDLTAGYNADKKSFDVADYEYLLVSGTAEPTTDAEGNEVEATDEEQAAAMAASKTTADGLYASFQGGKSLSSLEDADKGITYSKSEAVTYSDSTLMNWVFDDARKAGDSAVLEVDGTGTYVVSFTARYRQEYNTVNVRHILVTPAATTLGEDDPAYDDDVAANKAAAKQTAEDILASWKAGEATEDSFAALANEKSEDGGSNTNGGLYEQVAQGDMVEPFDAWCFDSARKVGDTGIVETDYGYHVMYFSGFDLPYWKIQVQNKLKNADVSEWYTAKTEGAEITTDGSGMKYVG